MPAPALGDTRRMSQQNPDHRSRLREIARDAMLERGFSPEFEPEVLAEVEALRGELPAEGGAVRDLTHLPWFSIDNDESRDLDQVSVAEPLASGAVRILVGIADVDARARHGSATDSHARTNTTSVYTPGGVFSMLPERLSYDLTSLNEGEERLACVVAMEISSDGAMLGFDVYRAVVKNHARLTYGAVGDWLDGSGQAPEAIAALPEIAQQLRAQDEVARDLKQIRYENGALSLHSLEARPVFSGASLVDLRPERTNRAKELIENLMIAANGATARFLESRGVPSIRRVVREPARWRRIVELAASLGEELPAEPDSKALASFLGRRKAADPLRFPDLSLSIVKLMGPGEYAVEVPGQNSPGHFGLAAKDYTHSTAPNRRYPDLITQRLLKAALSGAPCPYTAEELAALARHCTLKENDASKVERRLKKSAAALVLSGRVGDTFDGIITGAAEKGTWVRILHPPVEGRVVRGANGLDVGDRVTVRLVDTDVERGFIDFAHQRA